LLLKSFFYLTGTRRKFEVNVVQVTLLVLAFANLIRTVTIFVDPIFSAGVFPFEIGTFFQSITFPFELTANLLIAFYWMGLIDTTHLEVVTFLGNKSIPFIIIGAFFFLQEIIQGVLRAFGNTGFYILYLITITAGAYVIMNVLVSGFFFIIGVKVLRETASMRDELSLKLRKVTIKILVSGAFSTLWLIPLIIASAASNIFWDPYGHITTWFFLNFFLLGNSFSLISAIKIPPKSSGSGSNTQSGSITTAKNR